MCTLATAHPTASEKVPQTPSPAVPSQCRISAVFLQGCQINVAYSPHNSGLNSHVTSYSTTKDLALTALTMQLQHLPVEIHVELLRLDPSSSLKCASSYFYMLYNDLFYRKIIDTFGDDIVNVIIKVLPWLKAYIKTLDAFRYTARNTVASRLHLRDIDTSVMDIINYKYDADSSNLQNPLNCIYIRDSWRYIYSILKNKRLFAEYSDYKIDEPTNYIYNHFVEINRTYLLSYTKSLWLAPGTYNLNIGLVIKHGNGLGTTKFEIKYQDKDGAFVSQTFYPPTNINDILPKRQFCFLKVGEFKIPPPHCVAPSGDYDQHNKLIKVQLIMEEIGLYLKSGFRIFFIDVSQPSILFNDFDLLYYTVRETDYRCFINIPLKNLYKALNYVQNGGTSGNLSIQKSKEKYGSGNPYNIIDDYDNSFLSDPIHNCIDENSSTDPDADAVTYPKIIHNKTLMRYANFYFNSKFISRYKFNTIYQRRQFINRYGDFDIDWAREEDLLQQSKASSASLSSQNQRDSYSNLNSISYQKNLANFQRLRSLNNSLEDLNTNSDARACVYDKYGFKWKMPILGEL